MEQGQKLYGQKPFHGRARAQLARSVFCRVREFKIVIATLQRSSGQYEQRNR